MLEFNEQKAKIEINVNEIKLFQNLLNNFHTKINTIQTNFYLLSNSKKLF
jgi:hypothetical protein